VIPTPNAQASTLRRAETSAAGCVHRHRNTVRIARVLKTLKRLGKPCDSIRHMRLQSHSLSVDISTRVIG
jgi:hypothetical protein